MKNLDTDGSQDKCRQCSDESSGFWATLPSATSGLVLPIMTPHRDSAAERDSIRRLLVWLLASYCITGLGVILAILLEG